MLPLIVSRQHTVEGYDCLVGTNFAPLATPFRAWLAPLRCPPLSKLKPLCWVSVCFFNAHKNKIAAQRSGCDFERRRKGADGVFATGGNGVERTLRRRGGVDVPIDLITPSQGLSIQICQAVVLDPHHKIISDKLPRPLYFPLGLTPIWPAQNGLESIEAREVLKLPVQRGVLLLQKPLDDYLLLDGS